ncbi:MAG TPA: hypothetical protein VFY90_04540 [Tepidiformaceae bacterium]|nr:hypothetical protein [Tepidiformaceae bacterium]
MHNYYLARQRIEYALQELDGEGEAPDRLTRAWMHLTDLGRGDVDVPPSIAAAVAEMHADIEKWLLPRQRDALGTTVAWMDEAECRRAIDNIHTWRHAVDAAIAEQGAS